MPGDDISNRTSGCGQGEDSGRSPGKLQLGVRNVAARWAYLAPAAPKQNSCGLTCP